MGHQLGGINPEASTQLMRSGHIIRFVPGGPPTDAPDDTAPARLTRQFYGYRFVSHVSLGLTRISVLMIRNIKKQY
jgi:hypothetical protein